MVTWLFGNVSGLAGETLTTMERPFRAVADGGGAAEYVVLTLRTPEAQGQLLRSGLRQFTVRLRGRVERFTMEAAPAAL